MKANYFGNVLCNALLTNDNSLTLLPKVLKRSLENERNENIKAGLAAKDPAMKRILFKRAAKIQKQLIAANRGGGK